MTDHKRYKILRKKYKHGRRIQIRTYTKYEKKRITSSHYLISTTKYDHDKARFSRTTCSMRPSCFNAQHIMQMEAIGAIKLQIEELPQSGVCGTPH